MKDRHRTNVASFVILEKDEKILLTRRFNTGYRDGWYGMPSGHVEAGEYPVEAAAREAKEEVGVNIQIADLELVHVSYRINSEDVAGDYIDFFFKAAKWSREVVNQEPQKCDDLSWFAIDALPGNTIPILKGILEQISEKILFSEVGRV